MKKRGALIVVIALVVLVSGTLCCGPLLISTMSTLGPTPTPLPLWAANWEGVVVNTVCLEVEQSYPNAEGKGPEPIYEAIQDILDGAGIQVVGEGTPCDASLTLVLTMDARGAKYLGEQYCYSGAKAEGQVTLSASDRTPLTLTISGNRPTPFRIVGCPEPIDAPFEGAWLRAVYSGLAQLWGPRVLVQPLGADYRYEARQAAAEVLGEMGPAAVDVVPALIKALDASTEDVRVAAAEALGEIGPGAAEAIPALIETLKDSIKRVRLAAAGSLEAITGQSFGDDAERWQQWWEEQQ